MQRSWVTVATFGLPVDAHMARTQLESAGIKSQLADEHVVSANWFYGNAVGGVRLQVAEAELARAREVLRVSGEVEVDWASVDPSWSDEEREEAAPSVGCPRCQCADLSYEPFDRRLIFLSILLLGIPIPFMSRKWRCDRCGYEWKNKLFNGAKT